MRKLEKSDECGENIREASLVKKYMHTRKIKACCVRIFSVHGVRESVCVGVHVQLSKMSYVLHIENRCFGLPFEQIHMET